MNSQVTNTPGRLRSGVLSLPIGNRTDWLRIAAIVRVQAEGNYSRIYTKGGNSYLLAASLSNLAKRLPGFLRLHRSHLINPDFFERVLERGCLLALQTGERLPIARRRREMVWNYLAERI